MRQPFPPELCLFYPRDSLGAATGDGLSNIAVDDAPDGALCVVPGQGIYLLDKFSTVAVSSPTVVATLRGAAAPGRWSNINPLPFQIAASRVIQVDVPAILDGDSANVVVAGTSTDFVDCHAVIMLLSQEEVAAGLNPPDNLTAPYAWISNPPAGQITCRFAAAGGAVPATLDVNFLFVGIKLTF